MSDSREWEDRNSNTEKENILFYEKELYSDEGDSKSVGAITIRLHTRGKPYELERSLTLLTPIIDKEDYWLELIKFTEKYLVRQDKKLYKEVDKILKN